MTGQARGRGGIAAAEYYGGIQVLRLALSNGAARTTNDWQLDGSR